MSANTGQPMTENQKLREALHKAKAALSLALSDVDWRKDSLTQPVIHKAYNCAHEALAMPTAAPVGEREAFEPDQHTSRPARVGALKPSRAERGG